MSTEDNKFYVIKNDELYYHWEFSKNSTWVKDINDATIYDENKDQQGVPTYAYVIDGLQRYNGFPDAKLVEVERFYKEKNE